MKQIQYIILVLSICIAQKPTDIAYIKVSEKLNGSIPENFVLKAFQHSKLKKHKEIADRFARPYEKKSWVEYRKIFVKESRIVAGAKFYKENKELIIGIAKKYKVDPFIIVTIAGVYVLLMVFLCLHCLLSRLSNHEIHQEFLLLHFYKYHNPLKYLIYQQK